MTLTELQKLHPLRLPPFFFVLDVESVGLHGEGYSPGWVVIDTANGAEVDSGRLAVDTAVCDGYDEDRDWINENVPHIPPTHDSLGAMRELFLAVWLRWKARGAWLAADCPAPVETNFLAACIKRRLPVSRWDGPYPLIDIASVLLARGIDPLATLPRLENELPRHDPLCDARQSARYLMLALKGDQ